MFLLDLPTENLLYMVLYLVTLVLHVVAMNYVVAGAMVLAGAAVFRLFRNYCDATHAIVDVIKDWLPLALGVTITLGVAPILFIQLLYKQAFYTANLLLFHRWMAILPVLIVAFYLLYVQKSTWLQHRGKLLQAVVPIGVLLMFLFVAWSWTENHLLAIAGQQVWTDHYAEGRMWHTSAELAPRLAMWMLGALPTLAVIVAWQLHTTATATTVRRLALMAIVGGTAAGVTAIVYWTWLPSAVREAMLRPGHLVALLLGGAALVAVLLAWGQLARRGQLDRRWLWAATVATGTAIVCTTLLREVRRQVALESVGQWQATVEAAVESGHYNGLVTFFVFFALNGLAIAWVIWLVRRQIRPSEPA